MLPGVVPFLPASFPFMSLFLIVVIAESDTKMESLFTLHKNTLLAKFKKK